MTDARENQSRPIIGVGSVVFKEDKVLLIKRGNPPKENEWSLPGGAQEIGETVVEAAIREIYEETGIIATISGFLDVVDFIEKHEDGSVRFHYTLLDFAAEYVSGTAAANSDVTDARFFSLAQVAGLTLWTETQRIIDLAAKARGLL